MVAVAATHVRAGTSGGGSCSDAKVSNMIHQHDPPTRAAWCWQITSTALLRRQGVRARVCARVCVRGVVMVVVVCVCVCVCGGGGSSGVVHSFNFMNVYRFGKHAHSRALFALYIVLDMAVVRPVLRALQPPLADTGMPCRAAFAQCNQAEHSIPRPCWQVGTLPLRPAAVTHVWCCPS